MNLVRRWTICRRESKSSVNLIAGSCGGESGFEEIFTWVVPADGTYVMDTTDWYRDTVLYVLDGDCTGSELACNESPSTSQRSVLSVTAQEGDELLIVVDTDGSDTTATGLSIYPESDLVQQLFNLRIAGQKNFSY